uniref:Uncharacterized protein n=1 Tax=Rhodosorus marinus TaxID=101924 RepID=A0A7S0G2D1_9RHOD|mmetsp:Transcript_22566/g.32494  ORF Transcript_22566/g.32494 Transcript_22566/m.32494 type:complete len:163 (+) Transcript_22566:338-826(+)
MEMSQDLGERVNRIITTLKCFAKETQARNKRIGVVKQIIKEREFPAEDRNKRMKAFLAKGDVKAATKKSVRKFQNKESSDLKERVHVEVVKEYSLKLQELSEASAASSKMQNEEISKVEFAQPQLAKEVDLPLLTNANWEQDGDIVDPDWADNTQSEGAPYF